MARSLEKFEYAMLSVSHTHPSCVSQDVGVWIIIINWYSSILSPLSPKHAIWRVAKFSCLYCFLVKQVGRILFFILHEISVYDHLPYSDDQTTYFVWIM